MCYLSLIVFIVFLLLLPLTLSDTNADTNTVTNKDWHTITLKEGVLRDTIYPKPSKTTTKPNKTSKKASKVATHGPLIINVIDVQPGTYTSGSSSGSVTLHPKSNVTISGSPAEGVYNFAGYRILEELFHIEYLKGGNIGVMVSVICGSNEISFNIDVDDVLDIEGVSYVKGYLSVPISCEEAVGGGWEDRFRLKEERENREKERKEEEERREEEKRRKEKEKEKKRKEKGKCPKCQKCPKCEKCEKCKG
ncbi:hypothetical protein TrVE_jg36 [Triparma verrucosa]|uniref:Uncharacterized protein n=1 Tax=Triparma verrucosa TaxID=1606542 RepID=A0A9W7FH77_9STRA|nr:hypothetical protein TrVE_jg36 [Triparma verrucosa]